MDSDGFRLAEIVAEMAAEQHAQAVQGMVDAYHVDKAKVKAFLNLPSRPLKEFIVQQANLTPEEARIAIMCIKDGATQAEAAEGLYTSDKTISRTYKAAIQKLIAYCQYMSDMLKTIFMPGA